MQENTIVSNQGGEGEGFVSSQAAPSGQRPKLAAISDLLGSSLALYKQHLWKLIGVQLAQVLAGFLFAPLMVVAVLSGPAAAMWVIGGMTFVFLALTTLVTLTSIYIFHQGMGVGGALKLAFGSFFSYLWLVIAVTLTIMGGSLLLVVPGIIFAGWFVLSIYVFVVEGKKGFGAMMASKEYVRGYWWDVMGRLLVLGLISAAFQLLFMLPAMLGGQTVQNILGSISNLLFAPFALIYSYLIYQNLKELKPAIASAPAPEEKKGLFVGAAILGVVMMSLMLYVVLFLSPKPGAFSPQGAFPGEALEGIDLEEFEGFDPEVLEGLNIPQ